MFETSQEEQSSTAKVIVSIVIVVVVIALAAVYFLHFRQADDAASDAPPAAETAPAETADLADAAPATDLAILSIDLRPDTTETQALLDIRISNRSRQFVYSDIEYETFYYNAGGGLVSTRQGVLPGALQPGDQRNITGINDGLFPVGSQSYSMEIRNATASLPE